MKTLTFAWSRRGRPGPPRCARHAAALRRRRLHAESWVTLLLGCGTMLLPVPAAAQELRGLLSAFGQVREGDQSRETEAPTYVYGDLGLDRMRHGTELGAVFQLGRDFGSDDGSSDFYAGFVRVPALAPGIDMTFGRQFLSEGPGGAFVADGGKVRFDPGLPVAFTIFGGRPRYFEPTYSSPILDDDEWIFGGNIHSARWRTTQLSIGYLQQERSDRVLRQLVTGTMNQSLTMLPGLPNLYGSFAFDADHQNVDLGTAGVSWVLPGLRLQGNVEGTYYQPQDEDGGRPAFDINRREDPIFELFSVTEMAQWRAGLRYALWAHLSAMVDYSFQNYEHQEGSQRENSHIASAGVLWLPYGDGLETVRAEYYVIDSDGGRVNGGKASYESRVYDRLLFRTKLDLLVYDKERNEGDLAVSGLMGLGFVILPGLVCEVYLEANHNNRFNEDFRFGFAIDYNFRHGLRKRPAESEDQKGAAS